MVAVVADSLPRFCVLPSPSLPPSLPLSRSQSHPRLSPSLCMRARVYALGHARVSCPSSCQESATNTALAQKKGHRRPCCSQRVCGGPLRRRRCRQVCCSKSICLALYKIASDLSALLLSPSGLLFTLSRTDISACVPSRPVCARAFSSRFRELRALRHVRGWEQGGERDRFGVGSQGTQGGQVRRL
jgi:hypothetical protein